MAGTRINNYSPSTTDLTSVMNTLDYSRSGYIQLELTNKSTTAKPNIAAYSLVEIGGALYQFSSEEPVSSAGVGSTADAPIFIKIVPTSSQATAELSTITPVWRSDYHGWYESTTSINRFVGACIFISGLYNSKIELNQFFKNRVALWLSSFESTASSVHSLITANSFHDFFATYDQSSFGFTPKKAGQYIINYTTCLHAPSTSVGIIGCGIYIYVNGSNWSNLESSYTFSQNNVDYYSRVTRKDLNLTLQISLSTTDYVQFRGNTDSYGATLYNTNISIVEL